MTCHTAEQLHVGRSFDCVRCRYYFLKDLHPAAGGGRYLETPTFLKRWLLQAGIGQVNVREVPMSHPSDAGFRAFSGRGRRLAS